MAAKLPHTQISKHTKRNEFIMKKKLLRTRTSKRNAKCTNAHSVSLSRWLCQTTLNVAQMVLVIHKTLRLNYCQLLVARAAKTVICSLISFAHSILLRFAAQSFKMGLAVGLGLFILFHPINSYGQHFTTLACSHRGRYIKECELCGVGSPINVFVCKHSDKIELLSVTPNFYPERFIGDWIKEFAVFGLAWGQHAGWFNNEFPVIGIVSDKNIVTNTKTLCGGFTKVLNLPIKIKTNFIKFACVFYGSNWFCQTNPRSVLNDEITVSKVNASLSESQRFSCLIALRNTYHYICGKTSESQESSETTNHILSVLIGEFFLAITSVCLTFVVFFVHEHYKHLKNVVLIILAVASLWFANLFYAHAIGEDSFFFSTHLFSFL
jgi:hypothetical protein